MCKFIHTVMVKEFNKEAQYIRFINSDAAIQAVKLLNRQSNVAYAIRMTDMPEDNRPAWTRYGSCDLTTLLSQ